MSEQTIIQGDSAQELKKLPTDSVDLICTDPPYGYSFMGKDWDKAVPSVEVWKECLRVLKPGAFAFVMSAPRQDVLSQMIVRIGEAGFDTDFTSIYWTYASGFPKAMNIGKMVDKRNGTSPDESREFAAYIKARRQELGITLSRADQEVCGGTTNYSWFEGRPKGQRLPRLAEYERLKTLLQLDDRYDDFMGEAEREVIGHYKSDMGGLDGQRLGEKGGAITTSATPEAKALDGSYGGFQPKPAVEVIIVAMKPLSESTFVDQALKNWKGVTWLDDCRVPAQGRPLRVGDYKETENTAYDGRMDGSLKGGSKAVGETDLGRFPANLLVSDDVLNDGRVIKGATSNSRKGTGSFAFGDHDVQPSYGDAGSYSRYFDLDAWAKTLPFLIVPKASKGEKNEGLDDFEVKQATGGGGGIGDYADDVNSASGKYGSEKAPAKNFHPTVKPLKLMSYLITLGSRPDDLVLDPFLGSGTTAIAAKHLKRNCIGIELSPEYVEIANARLSKVVQQQLF